MSEYYPAISGEALPFGQPPVVDIPEGVRRIFALRAARELPAGASVNFGYGIPGGIPGVLAEQGRVGTYWGSVEQGIHNGQLMDGAMFGAARYPQAILPSVDQFDFYSGGGVDVLSQWTYSYPDPIRIGLAADELLATAASAGGKQQIMKMTQIISYRSQTAPIPKPGGQAPAYSAPWEIEQPDAPCITIAPHGEPPQRVERAEGQEHQVEQPGQDAVEQAHDGRHDAGQEM